MKKVRLLIVVVASYMTIKTLISTSFFSDLQFSSEEELDEVPLHEFEDSKGDFLIPAELPLDGNAADDDSQQVAEAMVQLGTMAYYPNEGDVGDNIMYKEGKFQSKISVVSISSRKTDLMSEYVLSFFNNSFFFL